jgi:hypothetical protein
LCSVGEHTFSAYSLPEMQRLVARFFDYDAIGVLTARLIRAARKSPGRSAHLPKHGITVGSFRMVCPRGAITVIVP